MVTVDTLYLSTEWEEMKNQEKILILSLVMVLMVLVIPVHGAIVSTTVLYLPINGSVLQDLSSSKQGASVGGLPTIIDSTTAGSNSPPKFGNGSILLNGTTDYVYTTMHSGNLVNNSWYVGFWANESQSATGVNGTLIAVNGNPTVGNTTISAFSVFRLGGNPGTLGYKASVNGTTFDITGAGSNSVPNNTWNYIACNRTTGNIYCSVNGTLDVTLTIPSTQSLFYNSSGRTYIGVDPGVTNFTKGEFDDVVIVNGNAFNTGVVPSWEYVKPLDAMFGLNHTYINPFPGVINVTNNTADVTATTFSFDFGDKYSPQVTTLNSPYQTILNHTYIWQGIYTIQETVGNGFTTATNSSWVLVVN
jgi:hypothetical protein